MASVVARMRKRSTPSSPSSTITSTTGNPLAQRSTRSTGQAPHYIPLEGAPPPARKPRRVATTMRDAEVVAITKTSSRKSSSARGAAAKQKTPTKRSKSAKTATERPVKRKRPSLPTPEPESSDEDNDGKDEQMADSSSASDSEQDVEQSLLRSRSITKKQADTPPARKRAQRTAVLPLSLPSPASTPTKHRSMSVESGTKFAPKVPSPLKPKQRRTAPGSSDLEDDEEEEGTAAIAAEEDIFGPVASSSTSTAATTPRKSAASTAKTTPTRSASRRNTPASSSRSSSRIQHLPPAVVDIKNAPASLRSRLVGFHMEDEGYRPSKKRGTSSKGDDEEEDEDEAVSSGAEDHLYEEEEEERQKRRKEKGKGRMMDEDEEDLVPEQASLPKPLSFGAALDSEDDDEEDEEMQFSLPTPPSQFSLPEPSSSQQQAPSAVPRSALTNARHPLVPSASKKAYLSSPLRAHLLSSLAVLSGSQLPLPRTLPDPQTQDSILGLPCLEGGYDEWERPLRSALEECVTKGMGNAVMLLGPRGVGKTMLVERSLKLLSHVHGADSFVTVRLSGLVHTTDRLAMRAIAVQLAAQGFSTGGTDGDMDDGDYSSNSATMSTLLRLLEPSSASTATSAETSSSSASTAAPTRTLTSKPLVIVVDEFDLFAQHPRQSFLYCLLDIVQGNRRRGGVAVIGVSARVDCLSLLEKRVRSRCQSHVLQMIPPSSFTSFCDRGKRLLRAAEDEEADWATAWNAEVEHFFGEKKVVDYMRRLWSIHGNVPTELRSALSHLLYRLDYDLRNHGLAASASAPRLSVDMLKPQPKGEDKVRDEVLKQLSLPELTVLIAAKHLTSSTLDRHAGFNFEMLYDAYVEHSRRVAASTSSSFSITHKPLSKPALRTAFDSLRAHEFLLARTSSSSSNNAGTTASAGGGMAVAMPSSAAYLSPVAKDPWKMYRLTTWAREVDREVEARGAECPLALRRWCKNWLD
ncbi:hypothetical protein JCM10908_003771 [Rhodotorula pacifica]|uniref:origin recognition complex subunit 4 n=1 Tax=Rhodotorula pacifica TaxID=1495444 RepID=UPI003181A558